MKTYQPFVFLLIATLFITACAGATPTSVSPATTVESPVTTTESQPSAPAITSKDVNLYAWSEYVPQALLDGFTQDTGVTIHYDTYSSNEELLAKLQAGASGYDVIIPSDYIVAIMVKQNMLEKLDKQQLPNFTNIDERFTNLEYDPSNQYTVPYQWGTSCMVVDTSKVTRPITKWADLWDPEFKDKVVLLDDEREVLGMVLTVLGYDKNSTDQAQLEAAKTKFQELKQNVKLFDSDSPKTALLAGEVWLGQTWNGEAAIAHGENSDIAYIFPEEGCTIWYDNLAIPKGAPHMDAAMALINYILKPESSILITQEFPYSSPNKAGLELLKTQDPTTYDAYMNYSATNPSADELKRTKMIVDVGDATTIWDRVWTEVKGGE